MSLTVFSTEFNHIARSATFPGEPRALSPEQIAQAYGTLRADIFEQLLLFDKVNFKVYGENAMLPPLISLFGMKAFEELLEQDAIGFTLWTPTVLFLESNIEGIDGLLHGSLNSKPHSDPAESIELGLKCLRDPLPRPMRRALTKKLVKTYRQPNAQLSGLAVGLTKSAYKSGKLERAGVQTSGRPIDSLLRTDKLILQKCADRLLEYRFLIDSGMTSFSDYEFFSFFRDTAEKVRAAESVTRNFGQLTTVEEVPDLKALIKQISDPYQRLPKLRSTRNALRFRKWIVKASLYGNPSIKESYLDALQEGLGFFETRAGRTIKSIAICSLGFVAGRMVGGMADAMLGGATASVLSPYIDKATDIAWDQIDEHLLQGLTKGWTPRMFFNDLKAIRDLRTETI